MLQFFMFHLSYNFAIVNICSREVREFSPAAFSPVYFHEFLTGAQLRAWLLARVGRSV